MEPVRHGTGVVISAAALAVLYFAVVLLRGHDYLGCAMLLPSGLWLLRAGTELMRPTAP
jgi:hypothetical protein